jgi:hypothetical protein
MQAVSKHPTLVNLYQPTRAEREIRYHSINDKNMHALKLQTTPNEVPTRINPKVYSVVSIS